MKRIRKKNDKNIRDMKMWVLGLVGTIFGSLIIALLVYAYGHIREVNKMFKPIFGYSFWTCFGLVNVISFSQCFILTFIYCCNYGNMQK